MNEITVILGIATGALSILTFLGGSYAYIKASSRKEYASERDIGHLKNNLKQMSANMEQLWQLTDRRFDYLDLKLTEISMKVGIDPPSTAGPPHRAGKNPMD